MARLIELFRRSATVSVGLGASALLGFAGNLVLARGLTVEHFTAVSVFLVAFRILTECLGRGLYFAMIRLAGIEGRQSASGAAIVIAETWRAQLRFGSVGLGVAVILALVVGPCLSSSPPGAPSNTWLLIAAAASAWIGNLVWHGLAVLQLRSRFAPYAALMIGHNALRVLLLVGLWLAGWLSVAWAVVAHLFANAVASPIALRLARRGASSGPTVKPAGEAAVDTRPELRARLARFGGVTILASTLSAACLELDLLLVRQSLGDAAAASYRLAYLFAQALELLTVAGVTVLVPEAGRAFGAAEKRACVVRGLHGGAIVAAIGLLTLPIVQVAIGAWFPPAYRGAIEVYPILLGGTLAAAVSQPVSVYFFSQDRPGRFVWLYGGTLAVLVAADCVLLPVVGVEGAAWVRTGTRGLQALTIFGFVWFDRVGRRA